MAREYAKSFYKSPQWQRCRNSYIKTRMAIDGGLCEECGTKLGYIVHHKQMLTPENITDPEISLNFKNLEYVCKDCHDLFDGHGLNKGAKPLSVKPLCTFDKEGQPISMRPIDRRSML